MDMELLNTVLICAVVVGVIGAIFAILIVIANKRIDKIVATFTPAQKDRLMNTEIYPLEGKPNGWIQEMLIVEVKDKGSKMAVSCIYYNKTIMNKTYQTYCPADFKVTKKEFEETGLSVGGFCQVGVDPETGVAKLV